MKRGLYLLAVGLLGLAGFRQAAAQDGAPTCPPGCKVIEEIVMKEHVTFCNKVVPLIKVKWVYDWVEDGFSVGHNPHCGSGLGCSHHGHCQQCQGHNCNVHCRKLLVKKRIEECIGQKCEVERIVDMVPCKVYRIVPCDTPPTAEPIPGPKVVVPDPKK